MRVISDPQVHCGWTTSDGHAAGPSRGRAVQTPTPRASELEGIGLKDEIAPCGHNFDPSGSSLT